MKYPNPTRRPVSVQYIIDKLIDSGEIAFEHRDEMERYLEQEMRRKSRLMIDRMTSAAAITVAVDRMVESNVT